MKNNYKSTRLLFAVAAFILAAVLGVSAQAQSSSKTNQIYRPCAGSTTPASVKITAAGGITATPCSNTSVTAGQTPSGAAGARLYLDALNGESSLEAGTTIYLTAPTVSMAASTTSIALNRTITAAGTTGARTINKLAGTVNFAAAATAIIVTNSTVTTSSIVIPVIRTADATCTFVKSVVPSAGSFTITLNAGCTAETSVGFLVLN